MDNYTKSVSPPLLAETTFLTSVHLRARRLTTRMSLMHLLIDRSVCVCMLVTKLLCLIFIKPVLWPSLDVVLCYCHCFCLLVWKVLELQTPKWLINRVWLNRVWGSISQMCQKLVLQYASMIKRWMINQIDQQGVALRRNLKWRKGYESVNLTGAVKIHSRWISITGSSAICSAGM